MCAERQCATATGLPHVSAKPTGSVCLFGIMNKKCKAVIVCHWLLNMNAFQEFVQSQRSRFLSAATTLLEFMGFILFFLFFCFFQNGKVTYFAFSQMFSEAASLIMYSSFFYFYLQS